MKSKKVKTTSKKTNYHNVIPKYVQYAAYMIHTGASIDETADYFDVKTSSIRDAIGHSIKTELPAMYHYIQKQRKMEG